MAAGVLVAVVVGLVVRPWDHGGADASVSVPRGSATEATLVLDVQAGRLDVTGTASGALLEARGRGDDPAATHDARGDEHEVRVSGGSAEVRLAADVAWTLRVTVGAQDVELDLGGLDVRGVDVAGGAGSVVLRLPPAVGTPRAVLDTGVQDLRVRLSGHDEAQVAVESGAGSLTVDGDRQDGVAAGTDATTPGFAAEEDHWDVVVRGGAGSVTVDNQG